MPMRWRLVRAGDVFLDTRGRPWIVTAHRLDGATCEVSASGCGTSLTRVVGPDDPIPVLVPLAERAALQRLRAAGVATTMLGKVG